MQENSTSSSSSRLSYTSKRTEKRTDIFWQQMQREIGDVATHVQNILNFQELTATKALGLLNNDDIVEIQQQMRQAAPRISKVVRNSEGSLMMSDFYGSFDDDPEHFTFSVGDFRVLQTVIDAVKQKGIHQFLCENSTKPNTTQEHSSASSASEMHKEWITLKKRIKCHYSNDSSGGVQLEQIIKSLDAIDVKPEVGKGGKIVATVPCGKCTRTVKLVREPPRSWPIYNIIRHFNGHININASNRNKKKKDFDENSSISNSDHKADHRKVSHQDNRFAEEDFVLEDDEDDERSISERENVSAECSPGSVQRLQTEYEVDEHSSLLLTESSRENVAAESSPATVQRLQIEYKVVEHLLTESSPSERENVAAECSSISVQRAQTEYEVHEHSSNLLTESSRENVAAKSSPASVQRLQIEYEAVEHLLTESSPSERENVAAECSSVSVQRLQTKHEVDEQEYSSNALNNVSPLKIESGQGNVREYFPTSTQDLQHESDKDDDYSMNYADSSFRSGSVQTNVVEYSPTSVQSSHHQSEVRQKHCSVNKQYEAEFFKFISSEQNDSVNDETLETENPTDVPEHTSDLNCSTFLDKLVNMHSRIKDCNIHSRRYDDLEKDLCTFEYLNAGNAHYQYVSANLSTMSKKTIQRHMQQYTMHIKEGVLDIQGLKKYLLENNYPLAVTLCEDGTRIRAATEYDYSSDSVKGLVSDLDVNGLPRQGVFNATSPYHIVNNLKTYPVGNYAYVQVAVPLASGAVPYVLYHTCSNNKFDFKDVLKRWAYTETLLRLEGITVVAHASDGDPRLMKSMKHRAGFDKPRVPSPWGQWFRVDCNLTLPISVQDMIHILNKLRNRMLNGDLKLGTYRITKDHLKELVNNFSKDKHGLCMSDIELKDKMSFKPTLKLINRNMIEFLKNNVPNSNGTVVFLELIHRLHRSFVEIDVPLLERVQDIWIATFVIRAWRNDCLRNKTFSSECITANAYYGVELDAHAILLFIAKCRDSNVPEQCIISSLSSQPCEQLFREMRSMSTTNQTVVNFTIKEFTEKLRRIYMKRFIMYKNQDQINFPFITNQKNKSNSQCHIPSNEEIIKVINNAQDLARKILLSIGMESTSIDMNDSVNNALNAAEIEFVDLGTAETSDDEMPHELYQNSNQHLDLDDSSGDEILNSDHVSANTGSSNEQHSVYEAAKIFPNFNDNLQLKNCRTGNKHTFKIADNKGEIKNVKKSTLLWMLTEGRHKLSADRVRRFQQREKLDVTMK